MGEKLPQVRSRAAEKQDQEPPRLQEIQGYCDSYFGLWGPLYLAFWNRAVPKPTPQPP